MPSVVNKEKKGVNKTIIMNQFHHMNGCNYVHVCPFNHQVPMGVDKHSNTKK
jgi:hypothetical protein